MWGLALISKTTLSKTLSKELGVARVNFDFQSDYEYLIPIGEISWQGPRLDKDSIF